jgi:hypothetical protein
MHLRKFTSDFNISGQPVVRPLRFYMQFGRQRYLYVSYLFARYCHYDFHSRLGLSVHILQVDRRLPGEYPESFVAKFSFLITGR